MSFLSSLLGRVDTAPKIQEQKKHEANISSFRDEAGISTHTLETGVWVISHQKYFVITLVIILALIGVSTVGYSLYNLAHYLIIGRAQDERLRHELSSASTIIHNQYGNIGYLNIGAVQVMPNQNGTIDFVGKIKNTTVRGVIYFSYYFDVNGQEVGGGTDFILPTETKYVVALGQTASVQGSTTNLVVSNVELRRLDPAIIDHWQKYQTDHLNFVVSDAKFIPGQISGLSEKLYLGEVSFTVTNMSAYGYKDARLLVILKSGNRLVGVTHYYLKNFRSGESRPVRFTWTGGVSAVNQVEVRPDVNPFDDSVFLPYSL